MLVNMNDRAPLEKARRLSDGRIAAVAKFARSGCYTYAGYEVGRPDLPSVTVYRPEEEVFAADAMASFAHKAITLNHPSDAVTSANWSKVAVGFTEGRVARDGGYIEIPLMLADASAVEAFEKGTARELSAGYSCELIWGDGIAPDGQRFNAKQVAIRGNHIALVAQGRAGPEARIGDSMSQAFDDAAIQTEVERLRHIHDATFAYMGDRAPAFDRERALQRVLSEQPARRPAPATVSDSEVNAAYSSMVDSLHNAWRPEQRASLDQARLDRNARVASAYRHQD